MLLTSTHGEYIVHWTQLMVTKTMEESVPFKSRHPGTELKVVSGVGGSDAA